jgi:hypothetical protein
MFNATGYAKEKTGKKEWDFLRVRLAEEKKLQRLSNSKDLVKAISEQTVMVEGTKLDAPDYFKITRFINGDVANPSNGLIEYLYKFLFKTTREGFWRDAELVKLYDNFILDTTAPEQIQALKTRVQDLESQLAASQSQNTEGGKNDLDIPKIQKENKSGGKKLRRWQMALAVVAVLLGLLAGLFFQKHQEWAILKRDFHFPDLKKNTWIKPNLQQFVGVWTGYIGSTMARRDTAFDKKIAKIVWEFTDSGMGYLKVRRWGANIYFEGFAVMETPDVISFHVWRQPANDFPRHSMARLNSAGGNTDLVSIAVSWTFGSRDNEEIGIREELVQFCKGCTVKSAQIFDSPTDQHSDIELSNGQKLDTRYIPLNTLPANKRYLIDSTSFIRKHPF